MHVNELFFLLLICVCWFYLQPFNYKHKDDREEKIPPQLVSPLYTSFFSSKFIFIPLSNKFF
jgi:hypothetical protein